MLARILSLHGFRVGLFTSPHLVTVRERIRTGDAFIDEESFSLSLTLLKEKIETLIQKKKLLSPPTYFEMLSCLAFLHFDSTEVDISVLEVGMGGRFDATNVVHPLVSVITTISPEHQKFLGETNAQIAFEKSGIMRLGVPVVCGAEDSEAYTTLQKRAQETGAPFYGVFKQPESFKTGRAGGHTAFVFQTGGEIYSYSPALEGTHQGKNAAVAIAAAEQLSLSWKKLKKDIIIRGVETVLWDGRLEMYSKKPLVLLDGAHNEEGAHALKNYIQEFLSPPVILVFASMRDKKIESMADILFPLADKVIVTQFPYYRAADPKEIQARSIKYQDKIILEPDVRRAVRLSLREVKNQQPVVIAGSLFLVGEVKKQFPNGL
jgi:dihydrofolate synthase/folylpolyglutamate synthase